MYLSFLRPSAHLVFKKWLPSLYLLFLTGCEDQAGLRESNQQAPQPVTRMTEFGPGTTDATNSTHPYINSRHAINEGKRLYSWFNCVGCHANGGGGMGPPLIDATWIYGSTPANIYSSIMEGRPNGMPAFYGKIPEQEAWKIVAYVRSLGGLDAGLPKGATSKPLQDNSSQVNPSQDEENHKGVTADSGTEQE
jgi:cytochrome c oxidase cbb3-type subunit 3